MAAAARDEPGIHRALADERRRRLLDGLRGAPGGLDVQELAHRLALHQNTVRWHLGVLNDAGLVERERRGSWAYYRVIPEPLAALRDLLR